MKLLARKKNLVERLIKHRSELFKGETKIKEAAKQTKICLAFGGVNIVKNCRTELQQPLFSATALKVTEFNFRYEL